MDFQQIFVTVAIILVGVMGSLGLIGYWNTSYGTNTSVGFNTTLIAVQSFSNTTITNLGTQTGNATTVSSGAGSTSTTGDLINRGLAVIIAVPKLLDLVPAMINDAAIMLGIPDIYVVIGVAVFLFGFALLFAYLMILGAKRVL